MKLVVLQPGYLPWLGFFDQMHWSWVAVSTPSRHDQTPFGAIASDKSPVNNSVQPPESGWGLGGAGSSAGAAVIQPRPRIESVNARAIVFIVVSSLAETRLAGIPGTPS